MHRFSGTLTAGLVVFACMGKVAAVAQVEAPVGAQLMQGAQCVVKIPGNYFQSKTNFWAKTSWVATVTASHTGDFGARVNGTERWLVGGFPSLASVSVAGIKRDDAKKTTEVKLKDKFREIKLTLEGGDPKALFAAACATPAGADAYKKEAYLLIATKFFAETPLSHLSDARKVALANFAHATANGTTLGTQVYKDNLYLVVDLGPYGTEYNSLRLNQQQRIARVVNESMLVALKAFAAVVAEHQDIYGLKFVVGIGHRPFTQTYGTEIDKLEVFVPAAEIKRFADADITSQALIDKSVLLVNDNRIEVRLSES